MTRTVSQIRVQVFPAWLWLGNPGTDARVRGTLEALLAGRPRSVRLVSPNDVRVAKGGK